LGKIIGWGRRKVKAIEKAHSFYRKKTLRERSVVDRSLARGRWGGREKKKIRTKK